MPRREIAMLDIHGSPQRAAFGSSRRTLLRLGALGALDVATLSRLRASAPSTSPGSFGRARRCVLLFLTGGAPQHDTFDPKPAAPAEYRGELKPIATSVAGTQVSELFPLLAQQAQRYCLVRSVTHHDNVHTSAGYSMLTGMPHPQANARSATDIRPSGQDHPHLGAMLAWARPSPGGLPVHAALPEIIKDAGVNTFPGLDGGLLGQQYAPFRVEANPAGTALALPDVFVDPGEFGGRRTLLRRVNRALGHLETQTVMADFDAWQQQAFALLRAPVLQRAFDLEREPERNRDRYGPHLFGQGCLLARRLLEAGLTLVSVYWHYEGPEDSPVWDTHQNNYPHLRQRLAPPTDRAVAALLSDLDQRGMLDDTLLLCLGEFGRTPRINRQAGRDHWAAVQTVLLAGAGIKGGSVYGASDRLGAYPASQPVAPADLTATALHLLGVAPHLELRDRAGRPVPACHGRALSGIFQ
jgi:hypothetical protein